MRADYSQFLTAVHREKPEEAPFPPSYCKRGAGMVNSR